MANMVLYDRRIILTVVLTSATLAIYIGCHVYYTNGQRRSLLPVITVGKINRYHVTMDKAPRKNRTLASQLAPSQLPEVGEINRYYVTTDKSPRKKKNHLTSLQIKDTIRQLGISNLTSEVAQQQFVKCAATSIMRTSPITIPPSHQHCKEMSFKSSGPIVALASFPGSGNSWVRQLLESATGIYTGAVYCDKSYIERGMIGEGVYTENVIAIKIHYAPSEAKELLNHDKAIYIIRSPFGAILSEQNRLHGKKTEKTAPSSLGTSVRHTFEANLTFGM